VLRSLESLRGYALRATDGEIGQVTEFYFDDLHWVVRYIVINTGGWFGPEVLIAPQAFRSADWAARVIDVNLTRAQVRNSPSVDLHQPISRQYEARYHAYFGYSPYWGGPGTWAATAPTAGALPDPILAAQRAAAAIEDAERARRSLDHPPPPIDSRLRSNKDVCGYHIQATDGEVGHVDDFIADDATWELRYIEIDTSNWIGGRSILIPRSALRDVDWPNRQLRVRVTRERIEKCPLQRAELGPELTAEDEQRLTAYYDVARR
jgi:hypothetical protein